MLGEEVGCVFLSHLHAWPDGESVREARPDAASGRLPWPLCEALLQPAWQVLPPTPTGDREQMTSSSWRWHRRGSPLATQQEGAGRCELGFWYPFPHFEGSVFSAKFGGGRGGL